MKENEIYIKHIVEAIDKINSYIGDISFKDFSKNDLLIDGVVRELEIIGEAVNQLDEDFKNFYHEIPWHKIVGMRNQLIHGYFAVDLEIVWETSKDDLPAFKQQLDQILVEPKE